MDDWSFGRIFTALPGAVPPDRAALVHGEHVTSWADFDRRTDALAATFLASGAVAGDKVALLLRNGPAYLETTVAAFKARLVHVNVNYRYSGHELHYILDNSDAAVLVVDAEFADLVATLDLPKLRLTLTVGDTYDAAAASGAVLTPQDHRGDDMLFIYTGGTTGVPKGVMWDQAALWHLMGGGGSTMHGEAPCSSLDELLDNTRSGRGVLRSLILPPLMHGSGFLVAIYTLARGGTVITLPSAGYHPVEALTACAAHAPDYAVIVGDAFARPLLKALDEGAGSIASLRTIISSGTMWSPEIKAGLLRHNPLLVTVDALSSSEGLGMGIAVRTSANAADATRFMADANTVVLDEDMRPVAPGSGVSGRIARAGLIPRGYYKDPVKSAATFVDHDGRRWSMPGDWATIEADGTLTLLGRGSQCINSGGEKIFPEEVEEALKTHHAVDDALVFGVSDPKWGQAVTAVVEGRAADERELIAHVRSQLAAYKAPKRIVVVTQVPRAANGKADYVRARELAG